MKGSQFLEGLPLPGPLSHFWCSARAATKLIILFMPCHPKGLPRILG